jgi:hypothetical protein
MVEETDDHRMTPRYHWSGDRQLNLDVALVVVPIV